MIRNVFFKTMMGAFLIGTVIISCVEVKDLYDPEYAAKLAEYRAKWEEQFGEIDPNEDWGFGSDEETAETSTNVVTRGDVDTQANMWGGYVEVPKRLTDEQINIVTVWFNNNKDPEGISVNWTDFFVQQVSSNDNAKEMSIFAGKDNTHMNNFNGGDCTVNNEIWDGTLNNPEDMNTKVFYSDKIQYIKNTDTSCFGFKSAKSENSDLIHYNYVIVPGDAIDESLVGMYFLGFDFESNGSTEEKNIPKDGYYSDWIIKITPAIYKNPRRIICEDLGQIGDFDFNDIVFDVADVGWNSVGVHEAIITVRAAGGTLPIFVGGVNIKEALGVADYVMVNTGAVGGVDGVPPATFRVPWPNSDNIKDIQVMVETQDAVCVLDAPIGDAPQKICVPADFVWPGERVNIKTLYGDFPNKGWADLSADEPGDDENTDDDDETNEGDNNTSYGALIAAEDLVSGQPIPAKYFENVGESCTLTFVALKINGSLVGNNDWGTNVAVGYSEEGLVEIILTGSLLEAAKSGTLVYYNYADIIPELYVK